MWGICNLFVIFCFAQLYRGLTEEAVCQLKVHSTTLSEYQLLSDMKQAGLSWVSSTCPIKRLIIKILGIIYMNL